MTRVALRLAVLRTVTVGIAVGALTPATAQSVASRATRDFVQSVAQSDAFETLSARSVLAQSSDPATRAFAQQMIADHTDLDNRLGQAASKAGVKPAAGAIGADQAPLLATLQSQTGGAFDTAYLQQQALAHRSALAVARHYAATGDDPALRATAAAAARTIAAHADQLAQISPRRVTP